MNHSTEIQETVRLSEVSKVFGTNGYSTFAIRDASISVWPGELVLLLGPSGSGKTTLLTLMAGLLKPTTGSVWLFGKNIEDHSDESRQLLRAHKLGFIFQNFLLIESLSVLENIMLVLKFAGTPKEEGLATAHRLLREFGIEHLASRLPHRLSQGEKQRVAIARAIANGAELIIADEPTASLESRQALEIIQLLKRMAKEGNRCVVVASHDLRLIAHADRVLRLHDGSIEPAEQRGIEINPEVEHVA